MELLNRKPVATFEVVIKDPTTGDDTDISINLKTTYSAEWREAKSKLPELIKNQGYNVEQSRAHMISSVVASWDGLIEDGKQLKCVPSTIERVLLEYPWITNQLDTELGNESNFYKT